MTWFRVDDGFSDHPKVHALQESRHWKGAMALWTLAGSWCAKHEKDGEVPAHTVKRLGGTKQEAEALVSVGLWERTTDGYRFHEWAERNPLREELDAKREKTKSRVSEWRRKKSENQNECNSVTEPFVTPPPVTLPPTLPIPSLPIPSPLAALEDNAREGGDFVAIRAMVRQEFSRRWGDAKEPGIWPLATSPDVDRLTDWLLSLGGDPASQLAQTLDTFFRDPWARSKHFPVGHLARHPSKYLEPRQEAPRGPQRRTARQAREEARQAFMADDLVLMKRLGAEAEELEEAEQRAAKGGWRARA